MLEKNLILQLKRLQNFKTRDSWRQLDRAALINLISAGQPTDKREAIDLPSVKARLPIFGLRISQPAMAVFLIVMIVFGGGVLSLRAARDTKPGDSLYIAKIINEKTQLVLTFDEKKKVRLGLEFASNRAKELRQVLGEEENDAQQEKVDRLVDNFKKQINIARSSLQKIQIRDEAAGKLNELPVTSPEKIVSEGAGGGTEDVDEGSSVFTANLGRDEKGLEVSDSPTQEAEPIVIPNEEPGEPLVEPVQEEVPATTSESAAIASTTPSEDNQEEGSNDRQQIAEAVEGQVEELLNKDDVNQDELNQLTDAIDQVNKGEVKGESEAATSSQPIEGISEEADNQGEVLGAEEQASATTTQ